MRLIVWWSLHFVAFGFFVKSIIVLVCCRNVCYSVNLLVS
jgi:hypothetical protein